MGERRCYKYIFKGSVTLKKSLRDEYFQKVQDQHLSQLRKTPLIVTHKDIYIFDSILAGLDAYINSGASIASDVPAAVETPSIDIDRSRLIRYLVSAKGLHDRSTGIPETAEKIYAAMNRAREVGKLIRFNTRSAFFLRYTSDEIVLHLLEAMIVEHIPVPHYFDGYKPYKRCNFTDIEWVQYEEIHRNRMELNRLNNGFQP